MDRPPPPPKRPAPQQQPADDDAVVTYKRRRSTSTSPPVLAAPCGGMAAAAVSSEHWASWRETLEGLLRSPSVASRGGGGIQSCVRDALACNRCHSAQQSNIGKGQGAEEEHPGKAVAASSAAAIEDAAATAARLEANKAMCSNALYDILVSEKFALLCHLLAGTFHVDRPDKVIDFEKIDARMRSGYYAQNAALFDDDIQQIWEKFEQVGRQMTNLASSLSIISRVSYQKPASGVSEVEVAEHRIEETSLAGVVRKVPRDSTITMQLTPCDSGHSTIPKRTETPVRHDSTCGYKGCGTTVDGEQGLICDRCDTMYHFACVKLVDPDIKQVPTTWHCPACINDSLHGGDCAICDQLDLMKPVENPELASKIELADEREGSSVSAMEEDNEPDLSTTALSNLCKHCGTCEDDDKKFVVCGHPYCVYKFYHIRCLKTSQLAIEQQKKLQCWYCPSCLCRGCFRDKDDDMIVMCDGCDDGYHTYCMKPVRHTIPKGKWYCTSCRIRRAREGMQKYENSVLQILGSVKHVSNANQSKVLQGGAPEK